MEWLYSSGFTIGFFLCLLLIAKREKSAADYILVIWLLLISVLLVSRYLVQTNEYLHFPELTVFGIPLPLTQGPCLYLYVLYQTQARRFRWKDMLHFLPLLISELLFIDFYFLPFGEKVSIVQQSGRGFETRLLINLAGIFISGLVYIPLAYLVLRKFRRNLKHDFSNTERINFNWLLYLIIGMAVVWIVVLFVQDDMLIYGSVAIFLLWIAYFGVRQVQVFSYTRTTYRNLEPAGEATAAATQPAVINEEVASDPELIRLFEQLTFILREKRPYRDPELTLTDLARLAGIHPNTLSKVINSQTGKSFYDLINGYRIDAFLEEVRKEENSQYTFMSIAYDCGFNSKASFNRNFKKHTGLTPTEYLRDNLAI
jgi:AraC-like DNA-binding protein